MTVRFDELPVQPDPAVTDELLKAGVAPHVAAASAQAATLRHSLDDRLNKKLPRSAARLYDRKRTLPHLLFPYRVKESWLDPDRYPNATRTADILKLLAHRLRDERTKRYPNNCRIRSIQIGMIGEAAILRKQRDRRRAA